MSKISREKILEKRSQKLSTVQILHKANSMRWQIYTARILNNLTTIASAREVIRQAYLTPKWEAELRRQALLRSAHASTALAGNKLSFKQVEALYSRRNKKDK